MSGTLFSRSPRRDSVQPQPRSVATLETSNVPQGGGFGPPPTSKGEWLCDEPCKYFLEPSKNPLQAFNGVVENRDQNRCKELKEEINFLMVVSGLFLAIVTAFVIMTYPRLQEDKLDTISNALLNVVQLLDNTNAQGNLQPPKPSSLYWDCHSGNF